MITMTDVYKNSNEWFIQQHDLEYSPREVYVLDTRTLFDKIIEYIKEII